MFSLRNEWATKNGKKEDLSGMLNRCASLPVALLFFFVVCPLAVVVHESSRNMCPFVDNGTCDEPYWNERLGIMAYRGCDYDTDTYDCHSCPTCANTRVCPGSGALAIPDTVFDDGSGPGAPYEPNRDCRWLLGPCSGNQRVHLRFESFDTEQWGTQVFLQDPEDGHYITSDLSGPGGDYDMAGEIGRTYTSQYRGERAYIEVGFRTGFSPNWEGKEGWQARWWCQ
eukprot:COSAG02_NODE_1226_length_13781_cov_2000.919828_5_plen_226_part_00